MSFAHAQIVNIPDPVFKAKLLSASSSNQIASTETPFNDNGFWSVFNHNTIDINNDGQIQVNEASTIKFLKISNLFLSDADITNMSGIEAFTNLVYLDCGVHQITSLNVSACTDLKFLNCSNNQISNLNVLGAINLEYLSCSFNQISNLEISSLIVLQTLSCSGNLIATLNLNGLSNLLSLNCSLNQLQNLNVTSLTNLVTLNCSSNLLSDLNLNGLINLKYLFCNYNPFLNPNINGLSNLIEYNCSNNQLQSLDLNNLVNLKTLNCSYNQILSIDISNLINLTTLNCSINQLTSLNIKNNSNVIWNDSFLTFFSNPNLVYICSDSEDLTLVQQKINGYGYTNCHTNSYCSFTPGGAFYTIQGNNKTDSNNNGCDSLDPVYTNLKFNINNGTTSGSLISNASGSYSISVQAGTHTLTPQFENPSYFTASPTSATVIFPATTSPFNQDFCIAPNGIHHDLEIVIIPVNVALPGFDANYKIKYKNKGNQTENTTINFNYNDAILDYVSSSVSPSTQATGILSWAVGTIAPFQSGEILVTLNVNSPMETPAVNGGDILSYSATASGLSTDETPDDNTFTLPQVVVNSFDPNDKTCLEGTTINPSNIGKYVHYKIRFENTGTFAAQNIVVKDMIETTKFDIASLQMTDASHSCFTRITNTNKVEFIFENINLPFDDATNDGYVVFKIKTKPTLVVGNTISNSANIYFDYNFPIVTNTATSTFTTLGNDTFAFDNYFTIYPNPVAEVLSIKAKQDAKILSLTIYTMLGQLVQTVINPTVTLNVADLKIGTYFVKLTTNNGVASSKFVKK